MDFSSLVLLCCASFAAGFVDAIVGGGGLIQTPATLIILPNYPVPTLLGTTKIPSFAGTGTAAWQYAKRVKFNKKLLLSIALCAFVAAFAGSYMATALSNQVFKPVILIILTGVFIYTAVNKNFGQTEHNPDAGKNALAYGICFGLLLGFYDGFIGPGTGSFLLLVFITFIGQDFLHSNAYAKMVNISTNLASILYFSSTGHILYQYAIPMAVCNVTGSFLGSKLALLKGNRFIRIFFLIVIAGTILRFAWDVFKLGSYF